MKKPKLPAWVKHLPRKVTIGARRWKIITNMLGGCSFVYSTSTIRVGCCQGRDTAIEGLIHEISEIVHIEVRNRFSQGSNVGNGDFMFVMDHDNFEIHNLMFVASLRECGLLK